MISTEQTEQSVHRFRDEVDSLYSVHSYIDRMVKEAVDSVANAVIGAIESHSPIIDLDLQNRQRLWSGEVSDEEYNSVEMVVNYLAANWLVSGKAVIQMIDRFELLLDDERVEQLRGLVVAMEANLRALDETERVMGPTATALEASALEENRSGQTRPFF